MPLPLPPELVRHHLKTLSPMMRQWSEKSVAPVLLLTGPRGIGKREIAYHLSQWLLCSRSGFGNSLGTEPEESLSLFDSEPSPPEQDTRTPEQRTEPCGECKNCQRALQNQWVDLKEISPDTSKSGTETLKIEQFREMRSSQGFGAFEGAFRIHLIPGAERMTTQAANSLLKILEEPPKGWIFILTANDPSLLLSTIVSRCQIIRLKPLPAEELTSLLLRNGVSDEKSRICAALAQGSWARALELKEDLHWEKREQIFRFLRSPQSELNGLVDWAAQDQSKLHLLLDHLQEITGELIRWNLNETADSGEIPLSLKDGQQAILQHVDGLVRKLGDRKKAMRFWIHQSERIFKARQEATLPLNKKLLVQDVLIPWLESA